mgnify:CR=1 FL=1
MTAHKSVSPAKSRSASQDAIAIEEEQNGIFPKVRASSIDMVELGARMAARQDELLAQAA